VSSLAFLSVLFAALLAASWNAIIKAGIDKHLDIILVSCAAALISLVALPFVPQPAVASWPYIAASTVTQPIYYLLLTAVYRTGEMSEVYPLMRGTAPLLIAMAGGPLIGEALPVQGWIAVALICGGVFALAIDAHRRNGATRSAAPFAFANAIVIAAYTLIDGVGVRKSAAPASYTMWIFVLSALPLLAWTLWRRRIDFLTHAGGRWHVGMFGGAATLGSYGVTLWAMTSSPIALVAALRETSIFFATAIAVLVLGERVSWMRYAAIAVIASGAIAIRRA
jgi:drug/metabolite transporter (DMT)-like permease